MKNTLLPLTLAAAALLVLPTFGYAQAIDGGFVNGNFGRTSFDSRWIDDSDTSYGVNVGYRWAASPETLIGFEAGYVDLGKYSFPASITSLQPVNVPWTEPEIYAGRGSTKTSGWTIGANGRFNLSPNWYIGGRAGFIRATLDSRIRINRPDNSVFRDDYTNHADGWYAGVGVGYDFKSNFSLALNYDKYSAKDQGYKLVNSDVVSVSGEYRF